MSRSMRMVERVAALAVVGLGGWCGYQLLAQNGRLFLRIEALEGRLAQLTSELATPAETPSSPKGFPAGTVVHDFALPTLSGGTMTLSQWTDRRVLLVFLDPRCGFSRQMLPDLARLDPDPDDGRAVPLVISTGTVAENRSLMGANGVRCSVLLQESDEVAHLYDVDGTPMGYLIDEHGVTASPLAIGRQALLDLAYAMPPDEANGRSATSPGSVYTPRRPQPSELSRVDEHSLPTGTMAPTFCLPRVDGGELSLVDLRGRRVLLVFSDPHCEPCDHLALKLETVHRTVPSIQVLMISRGDPEVNRAKVAALGLTFPVVLQRRWEISREYGILATPIGYLIDDAGAIATSVAVGADAILEAVYGAAR